MNKVFKIILNIILISIILILSIYLILKYTNKIGIYKVMTHSMENKIHAGDYLLVIKNKEYKKGDIVTYKKENYYITHRIIKINKNSVITKGDANNINDAKINKSDIVGKVIFKHKIFNFIINNRIILGLSIILLFIIIEIINM